MYDPLKDLQNYCKHDDVARRRLAPLLRYLENDKKNKQVLIDRYTTLLVHLAGKKATVKTIEQQLAPITYDVFNLTHQYDLAVTCSVREMTEVITKAVFKKSSEMQLNESRLAEERVEEMKHNRKAAKPFADRQRDQERIRRRRIQRIMEEE